jgi:hypothetical protein
MTINDYVFLTSDDVDGDKDLMSRAVDAVAKSALSRLEKFREMELNNLAYALARLENKDHPELLEGIGKQFGHPWRQRFDGQDIGTTMWALATLEYADADIFRTIASKIQINKSHIYRPQELSNMVWAAATAGVVPKYLDAFDTSLVTKRPSFAIVTSVEIHFSIITSYRRRAQIYFAHFRRRPCPNPILIIHKLVYNI